MKRRFRTLAARVDAWSVRERALLLMALVVVSISLWDMLLNQPLLGRQETLTRREESLVGELEALSGALERQAGAAIPSEDPHRRMERLRLDIQALDREMRGLTRRLVPPGQAVRILEDLRVRGDQLELVAIQSVPPEPFFTEEELAQASARGETVSQLYRHGLVLRFRGSYLGVMRYLEDVQGLDLNVFWDALELEVAEYPEAQIRLTLHTLSAEEGWLGV